MKQAGTRTWIGLVATIIVALAIALWPAFQGTEPASQPASNSPKYAAASQSDSDDVLDVDNPRDEYYDQNEAAPDPHGTVFYQMAASVYKTIETIEAEAEAATMAAIYPMRLYNPLSWDIDEALLVGGQGTTELWGTCGQCCIANTLNLVTGSAYTEADIVAFTLEQGLCETETGGMSLDDMADTYEKLLSKDQMGVFGYGGDYAPTINGLAALLERGIILNVSVYGEMMREGGHVGEGEVYGTHWIVLHSVDRAPDGSIAGFGIVDSASGITYLTTQELSDIYYGHDGTTITDPSCVKVYGRAR